MRRASPVLAEYGARGVVKKAQLSVANFKQKKRRSKEINFEQRFALAVTRAGLTSWHPLYKEAGWPDRYIKGGIWCELKSLKELGINSGLEPEQHVKLRELGNAGDRAFYVAKYQGRFLMIPYHVFKYEHDCKPLNAFGDHHFVFNYKDIDEVVKCLLSPRNEP
jgi:hypothetical protein